MCNNKNNETMDENNFNIIHIDDSSLSSDSVSIMNNREIMRYVINLQTKSFEDNKISLISNLIDPITKIFGDPNKTLRLEFMTKCWSLKYKDLIFNVYTAKNRGTTYEICDCTYDDVRNGKENKTIMEFLDKLYELINM